MADSSDSGSSKYNQELKEQCRSKLIKHAVRCLTTDRSNSVCVKREHVKGVWQQLLDSDHEEAKECFKEKEREQIQTLIDKWEDFYDGKVGTKDARRLRVCYLAGDDPTNDLKVFADNDVDCRNVVAIEKDPKTSNEAWKAINNSPPDSEFRKVKLVTDDILTFLKEDKAPFDIIYLDACGSLPSPKQKTLKIVGYVFLYNKLTSPGALITNFSFPPKDTPNSQATDEEKEMINLVGKEYMKNRLCNVMHGDNSPENNAEYLSKRTDEDNYGDYVSYQVIDSAYLFIPAQRMLESESTSLWGQMFRKKEHFLKWINSYSSANVEGTTKGTNEKSTKTTRNQELMQGLKEIKVDGKRAKKKCSEKLETLRKTLEEKHEVHTSNNLFSDLKRMAETFLEESNNRWCEAWIDEIFPDWVPEKIPEKSLETETEMETKTEKEKEEEKEREKEREKREEKRKEIPTRLLTPLLISSPIHIIYFSNVDFVLRCLGPLFKAVCGKKFPFCCDEATFQQTCLVAGLLYGLMTYPSFPVVDKLFRLRYTAKKRQMFADVFVFDQCRYVFDQFNAVSTACFAIEDQKQQIVFRMVVDGLRKHLRGICSEDLFRCCNVASRNEIVEGGVSYIRIPDRQKLE